MLHAGTTYIRKVRAVGCGPDTLAARLKVERALGAADLHPPSLAPDGVLCVRRFGRFRWNRVPRNVPEFVVWQHAMRAALDAVARAAAHPAREPVPADAEAVVFANGAELLACLAADWCAGDYGFRWWWQVLFPGAQPEIQVSAAWRQSPEAAPAALVRLAHTGLAIEFVGRLHPAQAQEIFDAMAVRFGLLGLRAVLARAAAANRPTPPEPRHPPAAGPHRGPRAPWEAWAPEDPGENLAAEARMLLVTGLMLYRAPAVVRGRAFARRVEEYWFRPPLQTPVESAPQAPALAESSGQPPPVPSVEIVAPGAPAPKRIPGVLPVEANPAAVSIPSTESVRGESATPAAAIQVTEPTPAKESPWAAAPVAPAPGLPRSFSQSAAEALETVEVETEFGGLLFIVNLAIRIGLYNDFTTPLSPGIALPVWDFLALTGRDLLGARIEADDLWPLLAALAGRKEDERPGGGFEPPDGAAFEDWLRRTLRDVRAQLERSIPVDDPGPVLCARPARLLISPTRLDAFFAIDDHPVAIRLSGLDRDPGWVPAAGRDIAFHFE